MRAPVSPIANVTSLGTLPFVCYWEMAPVIKGEVSQTIIAPAQTRVTPNLAAREDERNDVLKLRLQSDKMMAPPGRWRDLECGVK